MYAYTFLRWRVNRILPAEVLKNRGSRLSVKSQHDILKKTHLTGRFRRRILKEVSNEKEGVM